MWIKIASIFILLIIIASLFSALFFLVKDKGSSDRTVKALTVRIGLSVALFAMLIIAANYGLVGHSL